MKNKSTLFLKSAVILMGIPILALCIFALPQLFGEALEHAKLGETLGFIILGIVLIIYGSAIPFYIALYQAFNLLRYIDKSLAFSELSVAALKNIKKCALIISGMYVVALPLVAIVAEWDDAPGLVVVGMVMVGAPLVIAVFAAVLQRLLKEAIDIKSENDLTV